MEPGEIPISSRAWTWLRASSVDLAVAIARRGFRRDGTDELAGAAWRSYDAGARLAETAIHRLYSTPLFAEMVARGIDVAFFGQAVGVAIARSILRQLTSPAGEELAELRNELALLRRRLDEELRREQAAA